MPTEQADLIDQVNQSGFPFQLRIENEIRQSHDTGVKPHRWEILSTEHKWENLDTGETGYIDLILTMGAGMLVLECKRIVDANWIFLIQPNDEPNISGVRILQTFENKDGGRYRAWKQGTWFPMSYESSMCVLWRAKKNDPSLLERVASKLIDSVECLADEEALLRGDRIPKGTYVPMLVTNAELQICVFDPIKVNLDRGQLSTGDAKFQPVPFIRFRKALASRYDTFEQDGLDLQAANLRRERTVYVVQASHLSEFLRQCPYLYP